ncbi:MAG: M48 family metallopeptidase [Caulobacteraceae bacterium]|nr:M48 family metallopeptidase [Caulobacteraceae bacterium]
MQAVGLQTYIWNNNIRSTLLLLGFPILLLGMVFVMTLGMIWGGLLPSTGTGGGDLAYAGTLLAASAPAAIAVAAIWFAIAYVFNQAIIDIATGARKVERADEPEFFNLLENLCISRGLKTPTPRVIETDGLNAFASGLHEGRFSITATRGLLQNLDRDELEAVLAHELTHVINRDVRTMVIASIFAGIITLICQIIFRSIWWTGGGRGRGRGGGVFWLVAIVVAAVGYALAIVIRMAISRRREYVADAGSVELTKNPDAMISALQKVAGRTHLDAPQAMRAMFLEEDDEGVFGLFATHPPVAKRIAALQHYAGGRIVEHADPGVPLDQPRDIVAGAPGPWGGTMETPRAADSRPKAGPWG